MELSVVEQRYHAVLEVLHSRVPVAEVEAVICQLRTAHPKWGPRRLLHELGQCLLVRCRRGRRCIGCWCVISWSPPGRARRREDYRQWERPAPMQLRQLDIMGSVRLADGRDDWAPVGGPPAMRVGSGW